MKIKIFLTITIALLALQGMAQKLPNWVANKPTPTNSTYLYEVASATGQTESEARNRAIAEVMRTTALRIGQPFDSEEISRALQSGRDYGVISAQFNIPIYKVCEFIDNKVLPCRVFILCQVAKTGEYRPMFDDFNACYEGSDKYYANEALYADGRYVYKNGKRLSDSEVRTMFANSRSYDLFDRGQKLGYDKSAFYGLGAAAILMGGLCQYGWMDWDSNSGWGEDGVGKGFVIAGAALGGLGIGLIITGGICSSVGNAKIRQAVNLYNNGRMYSQNSIELEYGLTGNGMYVAFSF